MESHAGSGQAKAVGVQRRTVDEVRVVELDVPFGNLVFFFCECAIAAIPAAILLSVLYWMASSLIAGAAAAR